MNKAKVKYSFLDSLDDSGYIELVKFDNSLGNEHIKEDLIHLTGYCPINESRFSLVFDIPTAIKITKTLRTEINKAKEGGNNGNR